MVPSDSEKEKVNLSDVFSWSIATRQVIDTAKTVADVNISILVTGETGTGKDFLARAIHYSSIRKDAPFITINCAGIPDTLLESELFGHEKGAFTDAVQMKKGKFELAEGGTLFLDEIGDMSPGFQTKVLRAVESRVIERVGGEKQIPVNCRIISATNKDLKQAVRRKEFREDLFYRLCEVELPLPPLRDRPDEIPLLVNHFVSVFNREFKKNVTGPSDIVLSCLKKYHWPGNIRELKSVIRVGMVLIQRDQIWLEDMPFRVEMLKEEDVPCDKMDSCSLDDVERAHVFKVIEYCQWNKARTAELLKISRPTLDRKLARYNIKPKAVS